MTPDLLDWLVATGAGLTAALAGWPLTRAALHLAAVRHNRVEKAPADVLDAETGGADAEGPAAPASTEEAPSPVPAVAEDADLTRAVDDDGLLRGGLWIGLLERAIVAGGVALGEPTVLAVVVAIKGLGRVPELLKSPTAGERFMIGSLASLGVALACGTIGRALIG